MKQFRRFRVSLRFLVSLLLAGASAPVLAQQALDAWAPAGSQAPIELRVNDPVRGDIPFQPVHATLLPDGRVMLFAPSTFTRGRRGSCRPRSAIRSRACSG